MDRTRASPPQDPETAGDKTPSSVVLGLSSLSAPFAPESFLQAPPSSAAIDSSFAGAAAAGAPSMDDAPSSSEIDVMAQLAYFNSVSSRNRSFSAPIPPSSLGATWNAFADDTSVLGAPPQTALAPPPVLNMRVSGVQVENAAGAIGSAVPSAAQHLPDLHALSLSAAPTASAAPGEPENEPANAHAQLAQAAADKAAADAIGAPLPATFLRTICDQLEFYFCDENLLGDLFLLKNMNMDGYVKLDLLASFGRVKKLTTDMEQIKKALELSTKLLLSEDETMVCRKEPLSPDQTYHGKLARTAIAYNLPEDASVASLRETFQGCGEISYLRLLKKNTTTGRNAVLKPPIAAGETYAIIEFVDEEMAKHAVLTLSDQYNWRTGMQVVLFDGTNCDKLKQKMFPVEMGGGGDSRRRAKSASAISRPPVHVEAVGEGLDDLREGKVSTGVVYSIRGAGGLITPTRQDSACISFRLIPDEDGNVDIRQGDYVSFTVGKNKKSGRKYASKVKLEFRPPASLTGSTPDTHNSSNSSSTGGSGQQKDYFSSSSSSRWESRNRAATVGGPATQPYRARSSSSGTRPKLNLSSPRLSQSPPMIATPNGHSSGLMAPPPGLPATSGSNPLYRQALGPDGTRGFGLRRLGGAAAEPEMFSEPAKFSFPMERRRSRSTGGAMHPF